MQNPGAQARLQGQHQHRYCAVPDMVASPLVISQHYKKFQCNKPAPVTIFFLSILTETNSETKFQPERPSFYQGTLELLHNHHPAPVYCHQIFTNKNLPHQEKKKPLLLLWLSTLHHRLQKCGWCSGAVKSSKQQRQEPLQLVRDKVRPSGFSKMLKMHLGMKNTQQLTCWSATMQISNLQNNSAFSLTHKFQNDLILNSTPRYKRKIGQMMNILSLNPCYI